MKYEVIEFFTDLQDFNHPYNVGDAFPRIGMSVTQKRLNELASSNNKRKKPLIRAVGEIKGNDFIVDGEKVGKVEGDVINVTNQDIIEETLKDMENYYTRTDINTMNVSNLRKLASEQGIEDVDNISGAKLKNMLIEKMGL